MTTPRNIDWEAIKITSSILDHLTFDHNTEPWNQDKEDALQIVNAAQMRLRKGGK